MFIFINYKCKQQQHHLSWVFGFGWWLADSVKQGTINASSFCSPAKIYPPTTRLRARGPVGPTNGEEEAVSQPRTLSFPAFILNSCWMGLVPTTTASLLIRIIAFDSWFSHSNFVFFFWVIICCWFISTVLSLGSVHGVIEIYIYIYQNSQEIKKKKKQPISWIEFIILF